MLLYLKIMNYYIVFLPIFMIIVLFIYFRKNYNTENFVDIDKAIFANTLPDPKSIKVKEKSGVYIKYAPPLPEDNLKYTDLDKIYINPFFPDDPEKGTAKNKKPKQNYPNPQKMLPVQKDAFKFGYPNGMTMQDYVNWIYLFKNNSDLLNLEHYYNYEKLIAGIPIHYKKDKVPPPAKRLTPLNAENYFIDMYTKDPTTPIKGLTKRINEDVRVSSNQGSTTNGIMAANIDDYGNFKQNFDVKGTTGYIYNPELADKTDPNFLQFMVGPNWEVKGLRLDFIS